MTVWIILVDIFFFKAEDGIRYYKVTGVQTCSLPISPPASDRPLGPSPHCRRRAPASAPGSPERAPAPRASERPQIGRAHVELQSPCNLVCRLLLEKKKNTS